MTPPIAAVAVLLLLGAALLAYLQDVVGTVPESTTTALINSIIQALTFGGGLAVVGAFMLRHLGNYLADRAAVAAAEREEDKQERDRRYEQSVERDKRLFLMVEAQSERTFMLYEKERERGDRLLMECLGRAEPRTLPHGPPPAPSPRS